LSQGKRVEIEIDAIKTPAGEVPTVESVKKIVDGLNLLSEDVNAISLSLSESLNLLMAEVKSVQKVIANTVVSSEAAMEAVKRLERKIDSFLKMEIERWETLQQVLAIMSEVLKTIQSELHERTSETLSRLDTLLSLLIPPTAPSPEKKHFSEKKSKPLKKLR